MLNRLLPSLLLMLRLRSGPQDLPGSWSLTGMLLAVSFGMGMYIGHTLGGENAVARSLAINMLQVVAVVAMLQLRRMPERLPQTLSALAGTGIILGALAFGLLMQADPEVNQSLLGLAYLALVGWSLAVDAHIYRHALSINLSGGVLVAVMLLALSYIFSEVVF
ncbi:MAG: hypothetical protein HKN57_15160 [Xanthomonadales bacterium]|nr:hypothetical protein [Xanthomonadales bacterium]